jgi:hypothetical protein
VFLYAGRIAVEKSIEPFSASTARFAGWREGAALATACAGADVPVFPSRTDTFCLVLLAAMARRTRVAAFPVAWPLGVVGGSGAEL